MKIISVKDYEEMSRKVAAIIASQVIMNPRSVLGLATGSTPVGAYKLLIEGYKAGDLNFEDITTINLDEYKGLSHDNDQSYYYFMHENLFNHINVKEENVNVPNGLAEDAEAECRRYEALIEEKGGIDLQLLGLGNNGHIAFNEPQEDFPMTTHCVSLTKSTIEANKRFFACEDDVPKSAFTMGIGTIMKAKKIVLAVNGAKKAEAVKNSFFGPVTPMVPASILQMHPDVTIVADEEAMSLLK